MRKKNLVCGIKLCNVEENQGMCKKTLKSGMWKENSDNEQFLLGKVLLVQFRNRCLLFPLFHICNISYTNSFRTQILFPFSSFF